MAELVFKSRLPSIKNPCSLTSLSIVCLTLATINKQSLRNHLACLWRADDSALGILGSFGRDFFLLFQSFHHRGDSGGHLGYLSGAYLTPSAPQCCAHLPLTVSPLRILHAQCPAYCACLSSECYQWLSSAVLVWGG